MMVDHCHYRCPLLSKARQQHCWCEQQQLIKASVTDRVSSQSAARFSLLAFADLLQLDTFSRLMVLSVWLSASHWLRIYYKRWALCLPCWPHVACVLSYVKPELTAVWRMRECRLEQHRIRYLRLISRSLMIADQTENHQPIDCCSWNSNNVFVSYISFVSVCI